MLGKAEAPSRDWVFAGNLPHAMARSDKFSLSAADQLFDLREDRYAPKLVKKQDFTEIHMSYYNMLSAALQQLDHPYTGATKRPRATKKKKNR